jgi:dolichol-phosphate mannosyltransferase
MDEWGMTGAGLIALGRRLCYNGGTMSNPSAPGISVVLPTYNEGEHIVDLLAALQAVLPAGSELIVVDDDSPDGTWRLVEGYAAEHPEVVLLRRIGRRGLTSAFNEGIALAKGQVICWMDCDFSMPPEKLPELVAATDQVDIAIGSRYVPGGGDVGHSLMATAFSRAINLFAGIVLGFYVHDYTSGFIAARRRVLEAIPLHGDYGEYFIDLMARAKRLGLTVAEIPYTCVPRRSGESKTGANVWGYLRRGSKYVTTILRLRFS